MTPFSAPSTSLCGKDTCFLKFNYSHKHINGTMPGTMYLRPDKWKSIQHRCRNSLQLAARSQPRILTYSLRTDKSTRDGVNVGEREREREREKVSECVREREQQQLQYSVVSLTSSILIYYLALFIQLTASSSSLVNLVSFGRPSRSRTDSGVWSARKWGGNRGKNRH